MKYEMIKRVRVKFRFWYWMRNLQRCFYFIGPLGLGLGLVLGLGLGLERYTQQATVVYNVQK